MVNDVRKEQMLLLRAEKQIVGLAATLAAGAAAAKSVDGKLHATAGAEGLAEMQSALLQLAEATSKVHGALNAKALEAGATVYQATGGGLPKEDPLRVVASILGAG